MKTLLGFLLCVAAAHAGTVTISSDSGPGSLRQVLAEASDGETIQFAVSEVNLTSGQLTIDKNVMLSGAVVVARQSVLRFRIFEITPGHSVSLRGLTISNGYADASFGGGVFNDQSMLTLDGCTVSGNMSDSGDGGGGIYSTSTLTIVNSTVSGNRAGFTSGAPLGFGGGIRCAGSLQLSNSTVSGNMADLRGGGIDVAGGTAIILNSTFSGNQVGTATITGDGGGIYNSAVLNIGGTVLAAGHSGGNLVNIGTATSLGYNLSDDSGGGVLVAAGDKVNQNVMLSPLQNNGGPTLTHAPLSRSPAIDAGNPNYTPPPFFEQRGFMRVFGGRMDIGAVEVQPIPTPTPTATASSPTPTPTPTPTVSTPTPTPTTTPISTPLPTPTPETSFLANISTRGNVQADSPMIAGFILRGTAPTMVIVRGIGPSLTGSGIANLLEDPILELHDSAGTLLVSNDNWGNDMGTAVQLVSHGLGLPDFHEAGICAVLPPGNFTAILSGKDGAIGVGLVEVYNVER